MLRTLTPILIGADPHAKILVRSAPRIYTYAPDGVRWKGSKGTSLAMQDIGFSYSPQNVCRAQKKTTQVVEDRVAQRRAASAPFPTSLFGRDISPSNSPA